MTPRPYAECDTECDPLYWLIKFYLPDGRFYSYDIHAETGRPLDIASVQWFIDNFTLITFNGDHYDKAMIRLAMSGATTQRLKEMNDAIIVGGLKWWRADEMFPEIGNVTLPTLDHVDISEVAPGVRVGLKTYMGRMHSPMIQELPFDPAAAMPYHMRAVTDEYCSNDLRGTRELRETVAKRLELRVHASHKYGVDLRSKSDAQMAEAIFKAQLPFRPDRRYVPHGYEFYYVPPGCVRFTTPALQAALQTIRTSAFVVYDVDQLKDALPELEEFHASDGTKIKTGVKMPANIKGLTITLDGVTTFKLGIGGLHSQEKSTTWRAVLGQWALQIIDVRSYYPSLILALRLFPSQLGEAWLELYRAIYDGRLSAKDRVAALQALDNLTPELQAELAESINDTETYKTVLNGSFGKLFSKHSILFAPELGITVTVTGQLYLLMLIEALHMVGVTVISANTDGIVTMCPHGREFLRDAAVRWWEDTTGMKMEAENWKSLHAASVNAYIGIPWHGKPKRKGFFAPGGVLSGPQGAHPDCDICADAVTQYCIDGMPLMQTIMSSQDIRKFITLRAVKGGGQWRGEYLGKTVRWYYGTQGEPLRYVSNGNKVAGSDGAQPCMILPTTMPQDIDYAAYETKAKKLLAMVGMM